MSHMRADGVAGLTGFELTNATRKPRLWDVGGIWPACGTPGDQRLFA